MKCSFCGEPVARGRGKLFVRNDGRMFNFCSSKCHINFRLGRDAKKVRWTKAWSELKAKK